MWPLILLTYKWLTSRNLSFLFSFRTSYLTEELRTTREVIWRLKLFPFSLSLEDRESIRNWQFKELSALFRESVARSPKTWAEVISMRPFNSSTTSIFADKRWQASISFFSWSAIAISSTVIRFRRPTEILPTATFAPIFFPTSCSRKSPHESCIAGMCSNTIITVYMLIITHSKMAIMCFVVLINDIFVAKLLKKCMIMKFFLQLNTII